jgi:hypothetical protein
LAKWFCDHGFVWAVSARLCFFSAPAVIEDSAIAASPAAGKPESVSGVVPTGDINRVPKDGSIIATGSGNTAGARRTPA